MRRQIEIPNKLYHLTKEEYVPSIMESGLIPMKNIVGRFDYEDDRCGVFLSSDWKTIKECDDSFITDGLYLLEVDVTEFKDKLVPDPAYDFGEADEIFSEEDIEDGLYDQFSWYVNETIPPRCIKCLGTEPLKGC